MNRLISRNEKGDLLLCGEYVYGNNQDVYNGISLLEEYENTGLEPQEIIRVIKFGVPEWIGKYVEYRKLEEQGLLIKLPCKVGDFVFEANINRNIISSYIITAIVVGKNSRNYKWSLLDGIYSNMNGFNEFALGKSVFITREEAEKALGSKLND